jgi:DNA-binding transcriptional LysR family regulator
MDIDLLKTFLEVNRTRHFGRAADNLFLSQSAVSARIRLLEEQIGAPVFTRDRNDIQLTPIGRKLVTHAESIVTAWNRARQEVTLADNLEHSLVIGGSPSVWDILLQDWLHRVYKQMPGLRLITEAASPEVLLRRLLDGTLDLAFTFESPQIARLEVVEIFSVPLIMVSDQKGINVEQAFDKNYLLVDWGTSFLTSHAKNFKGAPAPRMQLGLGRIAQEFLKQVGGSAYLAEPMIKQDLKDKNLFKVKDAPIIKRSIYAVYQDQSSNRDIIETALAQIS